jgi:3-hydroxyisobutyrate dehydrogenase-like beta-hydroxyacid dehydrogenase
MRIGVLGLGRMGLPVAVALAAAPGVGAVVGVDPRVERRAALKRAGAGAGVILVGGGVREACAGAEVLVTVLPGPGEFEGCVGGILDALDAGALWVDLTSNDPRVLAATEPLARAAGVELVSAPMAGGPAEAESRRLRLTVSGDGRAVERARPLLAALCAGGTDDAGGGGIAVVGERIGDACTVKLLGNLLWFGQVAAATEAMLLGASLGLEPGLLHRLLTDGPGSSTMLARDYAAVLEGDYLPAFGLDRVVEELDTLTSLAADSGVPFELSGVVTRLHREALDRFGAVDGELLAARLLEERAGRPLRGPDPRLEASPAETETT